MIAALVSAAAARWGEREALVDDGGGRCSFAALERRAWQAAGALTTRGIVAGDRVALVAPNSIDFVAAWLGVTLAGATVVPIPTVSAPPEVAHRLAHARCSLLLDDAALTELFQAGGAPPPAAHTTPLPDDAPAMILYTSGTTGTAKAAAFSHASLAIHTANVARTVGLDEGDVILGTLPLTHSFGLRMVMLLGLHTGARVVLLRRFDAARALALADAEGVTFWPAVPTMLAAACAADGPRPRALRWVLSAGAPLPDALCRRAEARLGCEVRQGYGLTEASFSTIDAPPSARAIGSVGRAVEGVTVRIADGEIQVRGPHVTSGYLDDREATLAAFDDGWLRTGDVGRLDADGRLVIVDRTKDLIIRGGNNVYPSEVEAALAAHPAVADVAVIGRPDDYYGEEVVAVVVPRSVSAATPDLAAELAEFARARVASTKVPREYAFVDAMPLGPSGKVLKRELRRRLLDGGLPTTKPAR
ncbi:MAG: Long-chain fatty acid--CoA ligase [Myxococcales bacterium]|nr:Long-chain fatty acid--CoA ligase [Myxococcales bacterium]